jgi:adenine-specific DNA-methyltransferase
MHLAREGGAGYNITMNDNKTNFQVTTNNINFQNNDLGILKKNFSQCFDKNGDFDFEKFKKELSSNEINFSKESYGMDWLGKSYARVLATDPAKTLIKENKEWNEKPENKDSENLLLKGDNLEILKHLSNTYHEKVKMIYIDPPYNTGSDGFVYEDDRKFTAEQFSDLAGVDEEQAEKILSFVDSKSNSHSAWLTFMYPRLYIAKQLLKDDGVIFVSIDDNEVAQLRILLDEIFGEDSFVANIIWQKKYRPQNDAKQFSNEHDYILCVSKNVLSAGGWQRKLLPRSQQALKAYHNPDSDPRGSWSSSGLMIEGITKNGVYEIISPIGKSFYPSNGKRWSLSEESFKNAQNEGRIWFGINNSASPRLKRYLSEVQNGVVPSTIFMHERVGHTGTGTKDLDALNLTDYFVYPKPVSLISHLIKLSTEADDIILDFFAGSGTTGDAVMQLNAEDRANCKEVNRKYILVQIPEKIEPNKNKTVFDFVKNELGAEEPSIFEITKERLVRAAKKIQAENIDQLAKSEKVKCEGSDGDHCLSCKGDHSIKIDAKKAVDLSFIDFGFKIFETQPIWEGYEFEAKEFDAQQKLFDESKLSSEDLKTLLTTWKTYDNIPLTVSLESINLDGYIGQYGNGRLYLMDKGFLTKHLIAILNKIDHDKSFNPVSIIVFGYHFESKVLREIAENVSSYANKKKLDIDFITRY